MARAFFSNSVAVSGSALEGIGFEIELPTIRCGFGERSAFGRELHDGDVVGFFFPISGG